MVENRKNIYLIGMMGTGKSSAGKLVASQLHMDFIDSDNSIEEITQKSVSEIFSCYGEKRFREMEAEFIQHGHPSENCIISCGGGLCMNEGAFEAMRSKGLIICLSAEPETIYQRVKNDDKRPLLKVKDPILQIENILSERRNTYHKADLVIKTDGLQLNDIASRIINAAEVK